jgi:hypothetical protein
MARKGILNFGGFGIPPVVSTTPTRPESQQPANPSGDWIEKGFSSTPLASDAIGLKPSDLSPATGGSGDATTDGSAPSKSTPRIRAD